MFDDYYEDIDCEALMEAMMRWGEEEREMELLKQHELEEESKTIHVGGE